MQIQARQEFLAGVRLSDTFYALLKDLDDKCDAVLDPYYEEEMPKSFLILVPLSMLLDGPLEIQRFTI
jgi:hypothetical protein